MSLRSRDPVFGPSKCALLPSGHKRNVRRQWPDGAPRSPQRLSSNRNPLLVIEGSLPWLGIARTHIRGSENGTVTQMMRLELVGVGSVGLGGAGGEY